MPLPSVTLTVADNGLQQSFPANGNELYVIGPASTGPFYQVIQSTNPSNFLAAGEGSGTELASFITNGSGTPVAFVPVPVTGGWNTAVQSKVPGGSTSAVTVSGTPYDNAYAVVTVVVGGTIGTTGIQLNISLDNNRTVYQTVNLLTATSYVIPNTGLTVNFGAGTLVAGDYFTWCSTEGVWTEAAIQSAINALIPIPSLTPLDIIVAGGSCARATGNSFVTTPNSGFPGTVGVQPTDVTALDGYMTSLFNKRRFNRLLCAAGDASYGGTSTETEQIWLVSQETVFANVSSLRVGVTCGHYNAISPITQVQSRRPLLWQAAARDAAVQIQVDLGRVKDGALANMPLPSSPDGFVYHDESANPGLDAARFMACFSLPGKQGLFIANSNLMAPAGSDFNWLQHGHVMDEACQLALTYFINELSDSVRVNATTGYILAQDAQNLQQQMNAILFANMVSTNQVSAASCVVNQTTNILTTASLPVTISIVPLAYIKAIPILLTFVNPAVQAVQPTLGN